jgi:hypothetical protein
MRYQAQWHYQSALWRGPIEKGAILDLTDAQAAMLNSDSPGVVVPYVAPLGPLEYDDAPVKVAAPPEPEHRAAPTYAPRTPDPVVKRGPGRPPKNGG